MKKIFFLLILIIGHCTLQTSAQDNIIFEKANTAFRQGNYTYAIDQYQLIKNYQLSPQILYNLGTAHLKNGAVGLSILHLERARRLDNADPRIAQNLKAAQSRISDPLSNQQFIGEKILTQFTQLFSRNVWGLIIIFSLSIAALVYYFTSLKKNKQLTPIFYIMLIIFSLSLLALSIDYLYLSHKKYIVAVVGDQPFYIDATLSDLSKRTIPEGTKAELLHTDEKYYKVLLPNGIIAFVKKYNFEII